MPPKKVEPVIPVVPLSDIPCHYLTEKSQWADFKKSIITCGLTWNIPDWMSTIVYQGADYKILKESDSKLDTYFPAPVVTVGDNDIAVNETSKKLLKLLGIPRTLGSAYSTHRFCNLNKLEFEPDSKLPARQKLWTWFVKCLQGPKSTPGPYFYLTNQVDIYDISQLFKRLLQVLETVTICSLDDEVYNVTHLEFDPSSQDLFGYVEELRIAMERLRDLNEKLPEEGRVVLSETYVRSRVVRAARQIPAYKSVIDALVILPVQEWAAMSLVVLLQKLESAQANDLSLVPRRGHHHIVADDAVAANFLSKPNKNVQKKTCYTFSRTGSCSRPNCAFIHQAPTEQKQPTPPANSKPVDQPQPKNSEQSKKVIKCTWCGKNWHNEEKCNIKKAGKPKILASILFMTVMLY